MIFYGIIYAFACTYLTICKSLKPKNIKIFLFLLVLLFSLIAGIRYGIGTDYFYTYYPEYLSIKVGTGNYQQNFDVGVYFIFWLCINLNLGFQFSLFLISFLTFSFFFLGLYNFFKDNWIALFFGCITCLIFYFQLSFNIVRQVLAISTIFYAISLEKRINGKKRYACQILIMLLSFLFHKSSIIFIIFYLFKYFFSRKKFLIIQIIVFLTVIYLTIFNENLVIILKILKLESFSPYLKNVDLKITIGYIIRLLPMILTIILLRKNIENDHMLYFSVFCFLIAYVLRLLAYNVENYDTVYAVASSQADRMAHYFMVFQLYIYSYLFGKRDKNDVTILLKIIVISLILFIWIYDYGILNLNGTVPYKHI